MACAGKFPLAGVCIGLPIGVGAAALGVLYFYRGRYDQVLHDRDLTASEHATYTTPRRGKVMPWIQLSPMIENATPFCTSCSKVIVPCAASPVLRNSGRSAKTPSTEPSGRARIASIDIAAAKAMPGVHGVYTGADIRKAGLDFKAGDRALQVGRVLSTRDVALAAAMNLPWLSVHRKPRVAILSTGDELVMPGEPLKPIKIVVDIQQIWMPGVTWQRGFFMPLSAAGFEAP